MGLLSRSSRWFLDLFVWHDSSPLVRQWNCFCLGFPRAGFETVDKFTPNKLKPNLTVCELYGPVPSIRVGANQGAVMTE